MRRRSRLRRHFWVTSTRIVTNTWQTDTMRPPQPRAIWAIVASHASLSCVTCRSEAFISALVIAEMDAGVEAGVVAGREARRLNARSLVRIANRHHLPQERLVSISLRPGCSSKKVDLQNWKQNNNAFYIFIQYQYIRHNTISMSIFNIIYQSYIYINLIVNIGKQYLY